MVSPVLGIESSTIEQRSGQQDRGHPQKFCWWHQAVWGSQHAGGKGCYPEAGKAVWVSWSSARPSARSCTWVRAMPNTNTVWMENELRAALRRSTYWGIKRKVTSRSREVILPLYSSFIRRPWTTASSSRAPSLRRIWTRWKWSYRRSQRWGLDYISYEHKLWHLGVVQPGEEKGLGRS